MKPETTVEIMMALGTLRIGSFASSDSVEIASNPRNDRHRIAAPARTGPAPVTVPSPVSGVIKFTVPELETAATDITTNTTMNTACNPMTKTFALATETIPIMFNTVTKTIEIRIHTHGGTAGIAAVM